MLGHFGLIPPKDAFPRAKAAALSALNIDDTVAGVHVSLGLVRLMYDWDWDDAEAEIQAALRLAPNDVGAHFAYGEWLTAMGRMQEAVRELERALDLDPLSSPISANLAAAYWSVGQYDRSLEQSRKTVELDPSLGAAHSLLAAQLARCGRHDEAIEAANKSGIDYPERRESTLGLVYAIAGRNNEARQVAEELEQQPLLRRVTSALAYIYGALGDLDQAFRLLDEAYETRVSNLIFIRNSPELRNLHYDPRYADLIRRIGFPEQQLQVTR
jgi:tetratricopeptide (TPR) repeat protein